MLKVCLGLTLLSLLWLPVTQAESLPERTVTIGILTDLSGFGSYYGKQTQVGALLAQREIEQEGGKLNLIFEDSMFDTQNALIAVQSLLFREKVDALYVDFTAIATAVASVVEREKLPTIYSAAARSVAEKNSFTRKTLVDYVHGCEALAREFRTRGVKTIGVLKPETEFGLLCLRGVQAVYPTALVEDYAPSSTVNTQITRLKGKGVGAIINGSYEGDVLNMMRAMQSVRFRVPIGVPNDGISPKTLAEHAQFLNGSLIFGLKTLPERLQQEARKLPGGSLLSGFYAVGTARLHVKQLFYAAQRCAVGDGQCILEQIDASEPEPTLGFLGFHNRFAQFEINVSELRDGTQNYVRTYVMEAR